MKREFGKLKRKILLHTAAIALAGLALWGLVQHVFVSGAQRLPNVLEVAITEEGGLILGPDHLAALMDYLDGQRSAYLLTIGILAVLLVAFYYTMMRLTRYFRETSAGVDNLLEDGAPIALSPEMDFMQAKLTGVKAELSRRERAARDAERRKDELVVYLAHDIRTPLTTVIGYLNLMTEQPDMPTARRAKYLGLTLDSAMRLESLTDQLFEVTRTNAQGIRLNAQPFDLTLLLQQLAESFYPLLEPQRKRIELDAPPQLRIDGDVDKLARVFRNILKNAAAYSDAGSTIRICATEAGGSVTVSIKDTGIAIPEEALQSIFDPFHRLDSARSAKTGGAGLGLAIAKEIVQAHGGSISAASQAGESTFTVSLPISEQASPHRHAQLSETPPQT